MPVDGDLGSVLAALTCGVFVAVALPFTIPLLRRMAAIDTPNLRSSHTVPTPRGGGAPIAIGLVLAALIIHTTVTLTFGAVVGAFAAIGLADDVTSLTAGRRLAMQALLSLAAGWMLASRIGLPVVVAALAAVVLAIWIAGFVNAFNFMDGVNGISAGHALLGGIVYACLGFWRPDSLLAAAGAAVAAGALAFLPWNAVRARVFLGDVGSYALGAAMAMLAAHAVLRGIPAEAALGPLALYLADTAWTLQRRIRAGEPWLQAHRTHTYQQLCDIGWSHQRVTLVTGATTALVSLLGAVSLTPHPLLRAAADLAATALLIAYLRSPALLRPATAGRHATSGRHALRARPAIEGSAP
jgi:UDP-N-acetylmuramyl pentapeptide phosphotransferase/UDP-N-acetylglucosamine-1-phosphate transferase